MANIQEDLARIQNARYGEEVRGSIINAISDINDESVEAKEAAITAQNSAQASATEAAHQVGLAQNEVQNAKAEVVNAKREVGKAEAEVAKAQTQVSLATQQAEIAIDAKDDAETAETNAESWYNRTKQIAEQSLTGGLVPMGTIEFADLPALADAQIGWSYIVSDSFTTTSDFEDGAGESVAAWSTVYKTGNNKWGVAEGSSVNAVVINNTLYLGAIVNE